jgi:hypothetical protein
VYGSGRCPVDELPHCIGDPPPDRFAGPIALFRKFFRPYSTFYIRLVAVALEHQIGDAPDIDFGDHAGRLLG